jgi:hypothetical protein
MKSQTRGGRDDTNECDEIDGNTSIADNTDYRSNYYSLSERKFSEPSILSYLVPFFKWPDSSKVNATSAHHNSGTSERKQLSSRRSYAEWACP